MTEPRCSSLVKPNTRRRFLKTGLSAGGALAAAAVAGWPAATHAAGTEPAAPPAPAGTAAFPAAPPPIRITGVRFLRLKFPGTTPRSGTARSRAVAARPR